MSGHSKWATTKYRKGAQDKARAKLFAKLIRQIEVAAREGGGDINSNATLRSAFDKARSSSVPLDTIEKAIKRGTGELEGVKYEHISYEGYGPGGVAVIVECLSDNRSRTGAEIRNIFSKNGGSLAEPGAVAWQFKRSGVLVFKTNLEEDDLLGKLIDYGLQDLNKNEDETFQVICDPADLTSLRETITSIGSEVISSELSYVPVSQIEIEDPEQLKKILRLIGSLEEHDDVQEVFDNSEFSEELLATVAD